MIPTFNCAAYLRQTLQSVLAQDPGPAQMQIEVVDDCSTKDDPEAVVRELGGGRVQFHRQTENGGVTRNFNSCIERSRGHLVHILHGDDLVLPGFYATLGAAAAAHPEVSLIACRNLFIDEDGIVFSVSDRVKELEDGGKSVAPFFYTTPVQTPSVVVRRAFYERSGGFVPELPHAGDREMWTRATTQGGALVVPQVLASYRMFANSDSGRLARTADNLREASRFHAYLEAIYPEFNRARATANLCRAARAQANRFAAKGDLEAARANMAFWRQRATWRVILQTIARERLARFFR